MSIDSQRRVRILAIEHEHGTGPERFVTVAGRRRRRGGGDPAVPRRGDPRELGSFDALIVLGGSAGTAPKTLRTRGSPRSGDLLGALDRRGVPEPQHLPRRGDARRRRSMPPSLGGRTRRSGSTNLRATSAGKSDPVFGSLASPRDNRSSQPAAPGCRPCSSIRRRWHCPNGAELLITGSDAPVQAFRLGEFAWGTQFHPETDAGQIARWLDGR
jgi:GMP synthase (glutamine-hydrolysing)